MKSALELLSMLRPVSKERVKRDVARNTDGFFAKVPEGYTVVVSRYDQWEIVLDINAPAAPPSMLLGTPPATRVGIPFTPQRDFSLEVWRRGIIGGALYDRRKHRLAKHPEDTETVRREILPQLEEPRVVLGYGEFDYEFAFETSDERVLREIVADAEVREVLQGHRYPRFKITRSDEWLDAISQLPSRDVALVSFQLPLIVKDIATIRRVHQLLAKTMNKLKDLELASPVQPRLFAPSHDLRSGAF